MRKFRQVRGHSHQSKRLRTKQYIPLIFSVILILIITVAITACSNTSTPTPTPPVGSINATSTATVFQVQPVTDIAPTQIISSPSAPPVINLSTETYQHPEDLFSLLVPEEWTVSESQTSATFSDPKGETIISVHAINTGYALDSESFDRFVEGRESNIFDEYEDYLEIDRQYDQDRKAILIKKQYAKEDFPISVGSLYLQEEQTILLVDFRSKQEDFGAYKMVFESIIDSAEINSEAVANQLIYSSDADSYYQNEYFLINTPAYWKLNRLSGEYSLVETFYSPDERAIIQIVIYDDGEFLTRNVAGNLVRTLLREQYTKDVTVTANTVSQDGRERMIWNSDFANYQGVTQYETRGSALLMITVIWDNDLGSYYQSMLEEVINTYRIDGPNEG